jgi:hypothetical protein
MANPEHLARLKEGVETWNKWRAVNIGVKPDLNGADLDRAELVGADFSSANLRGANLSRANLVIANFSKADLSDANLTGAEVIQADLSGANLRRATLNDAILWEAKLIRADLRGAKLGRANLFLSDLSEADLSEADLQSAILIETNFTNAILSGCKIYGISVWDINLKNINQNGLIITPANQPVITVDNIEVAQFIYLLLSSQKIRDVINTVANKAVLILGRFGERKHILDSIADELRKRNYLPIMFDFERPTDRNFRETVQTLAGLSKFVIADLTDPKSTPLESLAIFYSYKIPFLPLIQEGQEPFSMFDDFKLEIGYIPPIRFKNIEEIKFIFDKQIILPAEEKHKLIREAKNN